MSSSSSSQQPRFTSQSETTQQRISSNTVGLVNLSDFRKRRAEVLEQQEREARDAITSASSAAATPDRSLTSTPDNSTESTKLKTNKKKKLNKSGAVKLSFGDDDDDNDQGSHEQASPPKSRGKTPKARRGVHEGDTDNSPLAEDAGGNKSGSSEAVEKRTKFKANAAVSLIPRSMTKSALRREAAERETLRQEFLARQEAVKNSEIAVPFVFYEGTNIPGGIVRVKKGDFIWFFLDKSRKVGADLGVGEKVNAMREWARVGVDDLMLVRGNVIIPPHYEFLYFIMNQTRGANGRPLFGYSTEAPVSRPGEASLSAEGPLSTPSQVALSLPDIRTLEGASDDPSFTKVVDKRWYDRNKHIYPASMWQDFDPEKEVHSQVRRDLGGNTFFYS